MLVILLLLLTLSPSLVQAGSTEEEYQKLQDRMSEQKKKIRHAQERESSILTEIEGVNIEMAKIEADIRKFRHELKRIETDITALEQEMEKTRRRIERQKDWIRRKMRAMQRLGYGTDVVIMLLSSTDVAQMMRSWKYVEHLALHEHKILEDYRRGLDELKEQDRRLTALREDVKRQTEKTHRKEEDLAGRKKVKETLLTSVRHEKSAHQKMLSELQAASKKLLDIMRESAKTDKYAAKGFQNLKGRLPWPVEGRVAIPYGLQRDPRYDTPIFRNGIHIQPDRDTDARAVSEGKVVFADWFKGFGQIVIVNHGSGYHSLYGNLSEIFSRSGDIIKENQVLGKVGTSGILDAPGLYFEIRYKGKPLDPSQWLRGRRK